MERLDGLLHESCRFPLSGDRFRIERRRDVRMMPLQLGERLVNLLAQER
jgi:hypothetical protein